MFRNDFTDGSSDQEISYSAQDGSSTGTAQFRLFINFDLRVRYAAYYVKPGQYSIGLIVSLLDRIDQSVQEIDTSVRMQMWHAAYDPFPGEESRDLPFTGRVFMYIEDLIDFSEQHAIVEYGLTKGLHVQFRDYRYRDFISDGSKPLAFISHDSRDKDLFVRPLVERLGALMCPVWYDEYSLKPGDSLRESIDSGLSEAPRCILVLSPRFLENPGWTKGEFNAAVNKHFNTGGSVLLPIWHEVRKEEVASYSSLVLDIKAIDSAIGIDEVARQIARVLKP